MDDACPLILEISSDEESGFGEAREGDFSGGGDGFGDRDDQDWLSKLLGEVDGEKDDDSDEVLMLSEVISNLKKPRLQSPKPACEFVCSGGDDNDDCVILDCEPDQPRRITTDRVDNHRGGDSDDLEILGEKGEIACRDFPHPRHLCANFAFASTPHDVHCSQCHCYVCDSLAPCVHWGTGTSSSGHCHASDKEEYWRTERKRIKKGDQPVPPLRSTIDAFFSAGLPQTTQAPALLPPLPNSLLQNQAFRQVPYRPCSISSTVNVPIAINRNRSHLAGRVVPRYKTHPQCSTQRLHTTCRSDTTSMGNNSYPINRGPQFIHRPAFKRPGFGEALPNNRHGYNRRYYRSQVSVSRGSPLKRCPGLNDVDSFNHQQNTVHRAASPVLPQPNFPVPLSMNVESTSYIYSQPQTHSQPHSSYAVGVPMHSQPRMPSQPFFSDNIENGLPFHSEVLSQPNLEVLGDTVPPLLDKVFQPNFPIPSQTLLSKQLDSCNDYGKQMHSTSVIPSHPNQSSQFQEFGEHTYSYINHQNTYHQSSHPQTVVDTNHQSCQAQTVVDTNPADFGVNWDDSLSHENLQISPEISQQQSATPADNFQYNNRHFPVSPDPDSLNFCFDKWIIDNQSFPGDLEVSPMSPGLSVFSP